MQIVLAFTLMFSELPGSVFWCLTLIWGNSQSLFFSIFMFLSPFHLLLVFPLHVCYVFCDCLASPWIFCSVFFSLCSLYFSLLEVSSDMSSSSQSLSSSVHSLLTSLSKAFFISVTVSVYLQHFFSVLSQSLPLPADIAHLFLPAVYFAHLLE